MEQIKLQVQGMSCGHCVKSVEDSVGALKGVNTVSVALDAGEVQVEFDPNAITIDNITEKIEDIGYDVVSA